MKIALLGDIALFGHCTSQDYFKEVANFLSDFDYVVGNLETPFSVVKKTHGAKSAYICADPQCVSILKQLHMNAVCIANNHIFDFGEEGYETTKKVLTENNIEFFGAEGREVRFERENNKLALSGFCCFSSNPLQCVNYGAYGVNAYDLIKAEEVLKRNASEGYYNIIAVHAGLEHVNYPSLDHVKAARKLSSIAPMVYYGHHPHVVQGIENTGNSLLAYSMGNFCFDDVYSSVSKEPIITLSENNRSSCIFNINMENSKILSWNITPIYIGKDKIHVGEGVTKDMIAKYTDAIQNMDSKKYNEMRTGLLVAYYESRKQKRNLNWYLKRLRPRYAKILLNARSNMKKYQKCIVKYL